MIRTIFELITLSLLSGGCADLASYPAGQAYSASHAAARLGGLVSLDTKGARE